MGRRMKTARLGVLGGELAKAVIHDLLSLFRLVPETCLTEGKPFLEIGHF